MRRIPAFAAALAFAASLSPAAAETAGGQAPAASALTIELNAVEPQAGACRLVFLATNALGADLSALVVETVVIDQSGKVVLLTLFDFRDLPQARPRVRQFDLAGTDCAKLGRVILNDIHACTGEGLDRAACKAGLQWSSRTDVELLG
jgi:hypothetical protein